MPLEQEESTAFTLARAAHRAARAEVDRLTEEDVPDGPIFDGAVETEIDAMGALTVVACAASEQLARLAYVLQMQTRDFGELCHTKAFGSLAIAVQAFCEQQPA